jgi:hypothetical protein
LVHHRRYRKRDERRGGVATGGVDEERLLNSAATVDRNDRLPIQRRRIEFVIVESKHVDRRAFDPVCIRVAEAHIPVLDRLGCQRDLVAF